MTIITGEKNIELAQFIVIAAGLKLEINTEMRHSTNSVFLRAQQLTGEKTRKKCLIKMEELIKKRKEELDDNR